MEGFVLWGSMHKVRMTAKDSFDMKCGPGSEKGTSGGP